MAAPYRIGDDDYVYRLVGKHQFDPKGPRRLKKNWLEAKYLMDQGDSVYIESILFKDGADPVERLRKAEQAWEKWGVLRIQVSELKAMIGEACKEVGIEDCGLEVVKTKGDTESIEEAHYHIRTTNPACNKNQISAMRNALLQKLDKPKYLIREPEEATSTEGAGDL